MKTLKIDFDNEKAREHFALWLCESGEQMYWEWMEYREQEEAGPITALQFNYHGPKKDSPNGFLPDGIIRTNCGRQDEY